MEKTQIVFLFSLVLFFAVNCWGPDGHQIVAQVASNYLTQQTKEAIAPILGSWTLANISTWPDNYDHTTWGAWSEQNHFVDLPTDALQFEYSACFPPALEYPGCVITSISNYTSILKDNYLKGTVQACTDDDEFEPCALSFLTHFMGDAHQPLHIAYAIDRGGNDFDVEYDYECTEIHSVWDSRLLYTYEDENDLYWDGIADQMVGWLNENNYTIAEFTNITRPDLWGSETFMLARFVPYNMSPSTVMPASNWLKDLNKYIQGYFNVDEKASPRTKTRTTTETCAGTLVGYNYYQKTIYVVFEQLAKAGVRLAYQLNSIYDPNFDGFGYYLNQ